MRASGASFFAFLIFSGMASRNEFPNEIIVTSADLVNGKIENIGKYGVQYRLYGIAAGYAYDNNQKELAQITITDTFGGNFRLIDLRKAGVYFLGGSNMIMGPVTVLDQNPPETQPGLPSRIPYTIYLVANSVPRLPVADAVEAASRRFIDSDDYVGLELSGLTILTADAFFTLGQFKLASGYPAFIIPRGHDHNANGGSAGSVLDLNTANAYNSQVTVFGPIATIMNPDAAQAGRFKFTYDVVTAQGSISSGSSLTLLSPNWLSSLDTYSSAWTDYQAAFDRQFIYEKDTLLDFVISASGLSLAENITVEIKTAKGESKQWSYGSKTNGDVRDTIWGNELRLKAIVADPSNPSTYPRFIIKVTSGASFSSVMAPMLLVFVFCQYNYGFK